MGGAHEVFLPPYRNRGGICTNLYIGIMKGMYAENVGLHGSKTPKSQLELYALLCRENISEHEIMLVMVGQTHDSVRVGPMVRCPRMDDPEQSHPRLEDTNHPFPAVISASKVLGSSSTHPIPKAGRHRYSMTWDPIVTTITKRAI
ncbi:hypothetical protein AAC387_Pa10g1804 [Persea americana]